MAMRRVSSLYTMKTGIQIIVLQFGSNLLHTNIISVTNTISQVVFEMSRLRIELNIHMQKVKTVTIQGINK